MNLKNLIISIFFSFSEILSLEVCVDLYKYVCIYIYICAKNQAVFQLSLSLFGFKLCTKRLLFLIKLNGSLTHLSSVSKSFVTPGKSPYS